MLLGFYDTLRDRQELAVAVTLAARPHRLETILADHRALRDTVLCGDIAAAQACLKQHLESTGGGLTTATGA